MSVRKACGSSVKKDILRREESECRARANNQRKGKAQKARMIKTARKVSEIRAKKVHRRFG